MIWKKVKIGDFLIRIKDLIPIINDNEYNLVTIKLYHKGVRLRKKVKGSEIQADKMSQVKAGQFILSGIDARNGAFGIIPNELEGAVVTNDFWHFEIDTNIISNEYFLWLTSTPYFDDICNKASDGTTNRIRLQADRFYSQELIIPQIQDQYRVVQKLKSTDNKIKLLEHEHQIQLTQLENLKQSILQEAVQGKLVHQNTNDEPAIELLKRIKTDKAKFAKKEKPLAPIKPEEIPFEIPKSWMWCRLGDIIYETQGGKSPNCLHKNVIDDEWGVIKTTAIQQMLFLENENKVLPENFVVLEQHKIFEGDVLITRAGPQNRVGIVCCVSKLSKKLILSDKTIRFKHSKDLINSNFLAIVYNSPKMKPIISSKMVGMAESQVNISQESMQTFLFPLPPLTEQKRIVAEIEKQLAKIKQLKEHILANKQATEQLLKTLLHQAFEVEEMEEV